jgi:hypothetical protein
LDIFRDPATNSLLAVIAILVPVVLWQRSRRRRSISYGVLATIPVLTERQEIGGRLEIRFNGEVVEDVSVALVQVFNSGTEAIQATDVERPLQLVIQGDGRILAAEIVETVPEQLIQPIELVDSKVVFAPTLLNAGDVVTLQPVLAQTRGTFALEGRVAGVSRFRRSAPPGQFEGWLGNLLLFVAILEGVLAGALVAAIITTWFPLDVQWAQGLGIACSIVGGFSAALIVTRLQAGPQSQSEEYRRVQRERQTGSKRAKS